MHRDDDHGRLLKALLFALLAHVAAAALLIPVLSMTSMDVLPQVMRVMMVSQEHSAVVSSAQSQPEASQPLAKKPERLKPAITQTRRAPSIMAVNASELAVKSENESAQDQSPPQLHELPTVADASTSASLAANSADPSPPSPIFPPQVAADYLTNPAPEYPAESRLAREEGMVLLRVHVGVDGHPDELTLHRSSHFSRLDAAAEEAVRKWKFFPGRQDGRAVAAWVIVPVRFSLRK